jgi:hypothetical protein
MFREYKYVLDADGDPRPEPDVLKWGAWFEESGERGDKNNRLLRLEWRRLRLAGARKQTWYPHPPDRRVAITALPRRVIVSTVFLAVDHGFFELEPYLWETMIFGNGHRLDGYQWRYRSRLGALVGHDHAAALAARYQRRQRKPKGQRRYIRREKSARRRS